ncbi:MAG: DUF2848 domain-containing protein [Caldimonas sp.]
MTTLRFAVEGGEPIELAATRLVVAGWTGRDRAAIEHHIEELARIGVPRPSAVPLYYRLAASLLTQEDRIEALGAASSGEAEPVLVRHGGRWWLTVGSDHTDRAVETYSVVVSKQLCAKPVARMAWRWDEVAPRADALLLRSEIAEGDAWVGYQEGTLAQIRPLVELIAGLPADAPVADGLVMFCGTLSAIAPAAGGEAIRPAPAMRVSIVDPVRGRTLFHEYRVGVLPMVA